MAKVKRRPDPEKKKSNPFADKKAPPFGKKDPKKKKKASY